MVKDPVCGMTIDSQSAAASIQYKDVTYFFCSQLCRTMFEREPEKHIKAEETKSE